MIVTTSETKGPAVAAAGDKSGARGLPPAPLAVELRIAVMRTSRRLRTEASGDAISPGQYSVLAAVQQTPMTLRQLADREHMQAPSMTRIVNALETAGLVARKDHPTDGRQILVEITAAGLASVTDARTRRTAWLAQRVAALEPEERAVLRRAARILQEMSAK
jgi:DNA-binding MarR family transcriptional regulator